MKKVTEEISQMETFVFGGDKKETLENIEGQQTEVKTEENGEVIENKSQKETIEKKEEVIVKSEKTETTENQKTETDKAENKPVNISFKKTEAKIEKAETQQKETLELTEESVLEWLKDKGVTADKISDLSKKEELSEGVAKFKKFQNETGRGHKDFYNAQKDWSKESKDDTIKEFYKYEHKNISDEDINDRIDLLKVTEEDEENLRDRELRQRKLEYNSEYAKALEFMKGKTEEYSTPLDSAVQKKAPTTEEIAESYKPYWEKRDKSLAKLTDVEFNIEGIGDIKLPVTTEHKQKISEITETQDSFINRWAGKDGTIDTDRSSEDTMWSVPEIRNEFIASIVEQAQALIIENFSKDKRNVTLGKEKIEQINPKQGAFQVIGDTETSKAGTPLI